MTAIKSGYGFIYAVDGALLPFITIFLADQHGLGPDQIGAVLAISAGAGVVGPPLITLLADRFGHADRLLAGTLLVSAVALIGFALSSGYWWLLLLYTVFGLAREPSRPLLDGIFFAGRRTEPSLAAAQFHRVRIWGSVGFMLPGLALYFVVGWQQDSLELLPFIACGFALASLALVPSLPARGPARPAGAPAGPSLLATARAAFGILARPHITGFVVAMFLLQMVMSAYAAFYPILATDQVGIATRWIGPLTTLGVGVELLYIAAFGWLVKKLGWRWFMVLGAAAAGLRMAALAAFPAVGSLVGTQLVHGLVIIVTLIGARAFLDEQATDSVRYSVQGLYAMVVMGGGRIAGSAIAGQLAANSLAQMFWVSAATSVVAVVLLAWSLRPAAIRAARSLHPSPDR